MIVVPVLVSVIWIAIARAREGGRETPFAPTTRAGSVALVSVALVIAVALTGASLAIAVAVGLVMLGLASFARWVRHDRGLLLVVPLVFGVSTLALPIFFE